METKQQENHAKTMPCQFKKQAEAGGNVCRCDACIGERLVGVQQDAPRWVIIDCHERKQVGKPYSSRRRARTRADKLDNDYGGYRYTVVAEDRAHLYTSEAP